MNNLKTNKNIKKVYFVDDFCFLSVKNFQVMKLNSTFGQ